MNKHIPGERAYDEIGRNGGRSCYIYQNEKKRATDSSQVKLKSPHGGFGASDWFSLVVKYPLFLGSTRALVFFFFFKLCLEKILRICGIIKQAAVRLHLLCAGTSTMTSAMTEIPPEFQLLSAI